MGKLLDAIKRKDAEQRLKVEYQRNLNTILIQLKESVAIVQNTNNLETCVSRLSFVFDRLADLYVAEQIGAYTKKPTFDQLSTEFKQDTIPAIKQCVDREMVVLRGRLDKLKTDRAKSNAMVSTKNKMIDIVSSSKIQARDQSEILEYIELSFRRLEGVA